MKYLKRLILLALLALVLLEGCRWSNPASDFVAFDVYNHTEGAEVGDPSTTPCTHGLRVDIFDYYTNSTLSGEPVLPGEHKASGVAVGTLAPAYQNPHYRLEALCLTDSGTGKSVREVQGQRLRFEIRPPNFKPGPNPDEVDPPGPWILEKGPLD